LSLVLVKLGGSLLTNKNKKESLKKKVLKRIVKEIHSARQKTDCSLVVGHGGGSYPHFPAKKYKVHEGIFNEESVKGFVLTQDAAARLNRIVVREFIDAGEKAVGVQPSACFVCERNRIVFSFLKPVAEMLSHGIIPVPYGDAVVDTDLGVTILSTERILREIAMKMEAKRIIIVSNVEGVFTDDPAKSKKAELIPEITSENYEKIKHYLSGSAGVDVTGGMIHKVDEMLALSEFGIESQIISGLKKGNLEKAILGESVGTVIRWA